MGQRRRQVGIGGIGQVDLDLHDAGPGRRLSPSMMKLSGTVMVELTWPGGRSPVGAGMALGRSVAV